MLSKLQKTTAPLLIEIGAEEMPPMALSHFEKSLQNTFENALRDLSLSFSTIKTYATPRRLAIYIEDCAQQQSTQFIEKKGPNVKAAYDKDGAPTPAATGFTKSLGITLKDCETRSTPKGDFLFYAAEKPGAMLHALLPEILLQAIKQLPMPKRMRWGSHTHQFIRPVHWLLALHGKEVIPLTLFGLAADRYTRGHRVHHPAPIKIADAAKYEKTLEKAHVIACRTTRKNRIMAQVNTHAEALSAIPQMDAAVLEEVTGLTEWPVSITGTFDEKHLKLPPEVPICAMQQHQRYFPLKNAQGGLINTFVVISNTDAKDMAVVQQGHERVIHARLSDAAFFYQHDIKTPLKQHLERLRHVVFQNKLGTYYDKIERITATATQLSTHIDAPQQQLSTACQLSKCDLMTQMVFEFTELQGVIGRYYALAQKEDEAVANALFEQYLPRFSGDTLPQTPIGTILALADRLDTLVGIFGIGMRPTGTKDPYALRRQMLAVIRILIDKTLPLGLDTLTSMARTSYPEGQFDPKNIGFLPGFWRDRIKTVLQDDHHLPVDVIEAALMAAPDMPYDTLLRAKALHAFKDSAQAKHLASAHKRVNNILQKHPSSQDDVATQHFEKDAEKTLYLQLQNAQTEVEKSKHSYPEILNTLATLQESVDDFFENVMVMSDNKTVRENRLSLLKKLHNLFSSVGDLSQLQGE